MTINREREKAVIDSDVGILLRKDLLDYEPYKSARHKQEGGVRGRGIDFEIYLDANENPYNVLGEGRINRYPLPQSLVLKERLMVEYEVCEGSDILLTRGADEGIDTLIRAFCYAGRDSIMIHTPSFGEYEALARIQGASVIKTEIDWLSGKLLDSKKILSNYKDGVKLVFICAPHNPTGLDCTLEEIEGLARELRGYAMVVVDEAYVEFSERKSAISLLGDNSNIVVLRTMSKVWGMAGLRIGSIIGSGSLVAFYVDYYRCFLSRSHRRG